MDRLADRSAPSGESGVDGAMIDSRDDSGPPTGFDDAGAVPAEITFDAGALTVPEDQPDSGLSAPDKGPACDSFSLASSVAGEKVNAAMCWGLGFYPEIFSCHFDSTGNFTLCESAEHWYEVDFYEQGSATYGDIFGAEQGVIRAPLVATVHQGQDGAFRFEDPAGAELGYCTVTGDVANLCLW